MAHEDLWRNEHFRKAFQRWWDEDWSWDGLKEKFRKSSLQHRDRSKSETLRRYWRAEGTRLIEFGGRKWTRFHLPAFDRDGRLCPEAIWRAAKGGDWRHEIQAQASSWTLPPDATLESAGLSAVREFSEYQGFVFADGASFEEKTLAGDFEDAIFLDGLRFHQRLVANFQNATFCGEVAVERCQFPAGADFSEAVFLSDADFSEAEFNSNAFFLGAVFAGTAAFGEARFGGHVYFDDSAFRGAAIFESAQFQQEVLCRDAHFIGDAWFYDAVFSGGVTFWNAVFSAHAAFSGAKSFAREVDFDGSQFLGQADFSGRRFEEQANFSNVRFHDVPKFHGAVLHDDTTFLNAKFRDGRSGRQLPPRRLAWFGYWDREYGEGRDKAKRNLRTYLRWRKVPLGMRHPGLRDVRRAHDAAAERYEMAYRQLRRLCAEIGSVEYEGLFHALELRAHRVRTDAAPLARASSYLYDKLSDYGRSMGRPVLTLATAWAVFATLYLLLLTPPYMTVGCAASTFPSRMQIWVAAAHAFLPTLFGTAARPDWLRCAEADHPLLLLMLSVTQVVVFVAAVSLFLIALRRRFQLKN